MGSSRSITSGAPTSTRASATRRRCPPLSVPVEAIDDVEDAEMREHAIDLVRAVPAAESLDLGGRLELLGEERVAGVRLLADRSR